MYPDERKWIIPFIAKRGTFFFLLMELFAIFLYGVGTAQEFTDAGQLMLLSLIRSLGFCLVISAVFALIANIILCSHRVSFRFALGLILYLAVSIFGNLAAVAASFLLVLAGGSGK
jgi:hypothetical protein